MRILTTEEINVIKSLKERGVSASIIAKAFGISPFTVYYNTNDTYKDKYRLRENCKAFRNLVNNTSNKDLFKMVRSYMDKKGY